MGVPKAIATTNPTGGSPVRDVRVRSLKEPTKTQLFVQAGGRCEFAGCNEYLLEHHLTLTPGNFAQAAQSWRSAPTDPGQTPNSPRSMSTI